MSASTGHELIENAAMECDSCGAITGPLTPVYLGLVGTALRVVMRICARCMGKGEG